MIDFKSAEAAFEEYLNEYDRDDDKIRLKIVHTYCVVDCVENIARRMGLPREDRELGMLIGLLHDIGRFEQIKRYDSFMPDTMDHAAYGAALLFGKQKMIRRFIEDDRWDGIIETAIARHSDFFPGGSRRGTKTPPCTADPGRGQTGQLPGKAGRVFGNTSGRIRPGTAERKTVSGSLGGLFEGAVRTFRRQENKAGLLGLLSGAAL